MNERRLWQLVVSEVSDVDEGLVFNQLLDHLCVALSAGPVKRGSALVWQ